MHHIYRQISSLRGFRPLVLAQKQEQAETFPWPGLQIVRRAWWRDLSRRWDALSGRPWQISRREAEQMRDALRKEGAGLLHIFFGNVAVHLEPLLELWDGPVVVSFHGADVTGRMNCPGYQAALQRVFDRCSATASRSDALRRQVVALGCPEAKAGVLRTVPPELPFRQRSFRPDGAWRLVQVCRWIPKKGLLTTLEAFRQFRENYPGATLTLAGSGPMEAELREKSADLGESIRLTGFLSQVQLRELLEASDVFLHPSETVAGDVEGVPNALLEAMVSGLPVVATHHGGIAEAVHQGGVLCPEKDPEAVADALLRVTAEAASYEAFSRSAREDVSVSFPSDGPDRFYRLLVANIRNDSTFFPKAE